MVMIIWVFVLYIQNKSFLICDYMCKKCQH